MILIKDLDNKETIGKEVIASIGENNPWVTYSDGNNGEKKYYRDVFSYETGCLIYSDGETCKIEGYDENSETVVLSNDSIDGLSKVFTIPYKQYVEDFTLISFS